MAKRRPREVDDLAYRFPLENILSKGKSGRNEAGAGRSKSQQKECEKCGLAGAGAGASAAPSEKTSQSGSLFPGEGLSCFHVTLLP